MLLPAKDESDAPENLPRRAWTAITALLVALSSSVFGGWELGTAVAGGRYGEAGLAFLAGQALVVVALWVAVLVVAAKHREARLGSWKLASFVAGAGQPHLLRPAAAPHHQPGHLPQASSAPSSSATSWHPHPSRSRRRASTSRVIAVKPSFVIGVGAWASVAVAAFRVRSRPELRIPLLFVAFYVLFLLRLPWAQTFYMMPAFPALAILLADMGVELFDRQARAPRSRWAPRPSPSSSRISCAATRTCT